MFLDVFLGCSNSCSNIFNVLGFSLSFGYLFAANETNHPMYLTHSQLVRRWNSGGIRVIFFVGTGGCVFGASSVFFSCFCVFVWGCVPLALSRLHPHDAFLHRHFFCYMSLIPISSHSIHFPLNKTFFHGQTQKKHSQTT